MKTDTHEVREMGTYHPHHHREEEEEDPLDLSSVAPPRISFSSSDFLDEKDFISINPKKPSITSASATTATNNSNSNNNCEFEFFFSGNSNVGGQTNTMLTADELFYDGKLLPFWQKKQRPADEMKEEEATEEVVAKVEEEEITVVNAEENKGGNGVNGKNKNSNSGSTGNRPSWYFDEDPSPRPPKCTVMWKELLRLKKQRASSSSSLSPSSSSSSTLSSSSSMADMANADNRKETADGTNGNLKEAYLQRIRKGLERTRSGSIRIRPILNVPVCTHHARTNSNGGGLPPMFPPGKGRSV